MYHAIVRARVRSLWARIAAGDFGAAVETASSDIHFRFLGPAPLGADLVGREAFAAWFALLNRTFPGIRISLVDVVASGPPWKTTVAARLRIEATLADGSLYRNEGAQWLTLRWGRMVEDVVVEDGAVLTDALARQARAAGTAVS